MHHKKARRLIFILQAAVSLSFLIFLISDTGFHARLSSILFSANHTWLTVGILVAGVVHLLCLIRWWICLKILAINIKFSESTGIFFSGLFFNCFLPGGAGGDVVKVGLLATRGYDVTLAALSVIMDRLIGFVSMVILGTILMISQYAWLTHSACITGLIDSVVLYFLLLALLLIILIVIGMLGSRLPAFWPGRMKIIEISQACFQCIVQWPRTLLALAISGVMLLLFFFTYYFAARAYNIDIGACHFLALMPTVDILSGLPVSLGGLGIREGVFTLLLGSLASIPAPTAVAISLTGYTISSIWGIPGAFLWLLHRKN